MLEESRLLELTAKQNLNGSDALALLQLLQEQTTPILSLRSSTVSSTDRHVGLNPRRRGGRVESSEGRREGGCGRDGGGAVLPKRALFGGQSGAGGAAPNVASMEEFPPMQPPSTATHTRKKDKSGRKPRRITLTSMQQQTPHQSPSSHFTPSHTTSDSWSSHPAFVGHHVATSPAPSPLSEERRMLRRERSKQQMKRGSDCSSNSGEQSLLNTGNTSESVAKCGSSGVKSVSDINPALSTRGDHACPPYIPAPTRPADSLVSTDSVSHKTTLDHLAHLHSKIITDRLVPNLTSEIHFIVRLLTCTQPVNPGQSTSGGSEHLFQTVDNCVYFAVRVLYEIRSFLTSLDTATLQLLSENIRINCFEPKLAKFLSGALERAESEIGEGRRRESQSFVVTNRVPFQEETDNLRNFPNMRVFHAFKKQRDSFYSILREWETNHQMPHWNFQSALRDRIRSVIGQPAELCSLDHLATLFQKQLVESCGYAAQLSAGMERLVEGPLKHLNPDKLMKLSERFQRQSHAGTGTCPPPSFSVSEQFFSSFLTTADSYTFNWHLTAALHQELLKLHSRCQSVAVRDVPEVLQAMKLLAKFLGYIEFLPYTNSASTSLLHTRTASPHVAMVSKCVSEAVENHHLPLTVPWTVEFVSMMDSRALQVPQYHSLLQQLITIYRSGLTEESECVSVDTFLVLTCLGWLFEIPNIHSSVFFQYLDTSGRNNSPSLPQSSFVTRDLLYVCCPYLAGIRITLAEFASGLPSRTSPIRKIKPIPAGPDGSSHTQSSPASQLQMKLRESFFRMHPHMLKQLCDTVSERVSETAIQLVQSQLIPEHIRIGLQSLALWIGQSCTDGSSTVDLEELFHRSETVKMVAQVSEETFSRVLNETFHFCKQHCETNTGRAIWALVCGTIPEQVVATAAGISTDQAVENCKKWTNTKLKGIVFQEVSGGFEKLRRAVRDGVKASQSQQSAPTSPHITPSPIASGLTERSSRSRNRSMSTLDQSSHQPLYLNSVENSHNPNCSMMSVPASLTDLRRAGGKEVSRRNSCPISLFLELASSVVAERHKAPSRDGVLEIMGATDSAREFIVTQVKVLEGGYAPHLLPPSTDKLFSVSIQLTTVLVAHGLMESTVSMHLTSLWTLLKGLKKEVPIHLLLSVDSFSQYLQQTQKGSERVWSCLSCVLMEIVELGIVATDVIEALWMCRIRQSSPPERQIIISGAANLLAEWFAGQQQVERGEGVGVFREICFVRLLNFVVSESDSPHIDSFRNHPSLTFLCL